jgi:hypothetical protein
MSMTPSVFTVESLAVELKRDRRTIARALRDVPADGKVRGRPAWRIVTALAHLGERPTSSNGVDAAAEAALAATDEVANFLDRLRAEPDVAVRRQMVRAEGGCVGAFSDTFGAIAKGDSVGRIVYDVLLAQAINTVLDLCNWKLDPAELSKETAWPAARRDRPLQRSPRS